MDRRLTVGKVCLTYGLCGIITLQPVFANVVIDNSAGNTSKSTAGNGVEVVNIATPNSQGLSHNQYQQFNVDPSGLILNNSTAQLARSQLGGILQNNPNLQGQAASVILNEVTGANRSQLEGYTEVFGQQANVILANPYGITCDGCGFINTPRVTLSTGTPDIQNGLVKGFDVAEGSVTIEGLGLDATKQTYFDIISRTAEINASIHANELSIVTGRNHVDYQTNQVSKNTSSIDSSSPTLAIDSSSLGGMYAGRISLVATEDGVGVNVGNLSSSIGNISIKSDGNIELRDASSAKSLSLSTQQELVLSGTQSAKLDTSLKAKDINTQQAHLVVGDSLSIQANSLTLDQSKLDANQLNTNVKSIEVGLDSSISTQSTHMQGLSSLNNQGQVSASDSLLLQGETSHLTGEGHIKSAKMNAYNVNLTVDTNLRSHNANLKANQLITLTNQARLSTSGDFTASSNTLELLGELTTNGTVELSSKKHSTINGSLDVGRNLLITADELNLGGSSHVNDSMSVAAREVTVVGTHQTVKGISVTSDTLHQQGTLSANHNVVFDVKRNFVNSGEVQSGNKLDLSANNLLNDGSLHALEKLGLTVNTLINKGTLISLNDLEFDVNGDIYNYSFIYSGANANFYLAGTLTNLEGDILSKGDLKIQKDASGNKTGAIRNLSGSIESHGAISAKTATLENSRKSIQHTSKTTNHAPRNLKRTVTGNYSCFFSCTAEHDEVRERHLYSKVESKVQVEGKAGRLVSGNEMKIEAEQVANNASQIYSGKDLVINVNRLTNNAYTDSSLESYGNYLIESGIVSSSFSWFTGNNLSGELASTQKTLQLISIDKKKTVNKTYRSSLEAGNKVYITASTETDNGSRGEGVQYNAYSNHVPKSVNKIGSSTSIQNKVPFPSFHFPISPNGLFIYSSGPKTKYIIETNPLLTDMGQFLGSDYFKQSIGFNPKSDVFFLGDAYYDTQVITQAIFEQTGQRYLNKEVGSDLNQMQQLIDAAAQQKAALNLDVGVALSDKQISQLTEDILWYEPVVIKGKEVLAPKLYLSSLSNRNISDGALIAGQDINIQAGDIFNSGTIEADESLTLISDERIINATGAIQADGDLTAETKGDIENLSGFISGDRVTLVSHDGNIINKTLNERLNVDSKGRLVNSSASDIVFTDTYVGDRAKVVSKDSLTILAEGSITNIASNLEAAGDATLNAGKHITITSIEDKQYRFLDELRRLEEQSNTFQIGSHFSSLGGLTMNAGSDVIVKASNITAANAVEIYAGNDVSFETALNEDYDRYQVYRYTQIEHSKQHQGSFVSGSDITVKAGNNITVKGSDVEAVESVNFAAQGDVNIVAVNDSQYHYDKTVNKKSFGRSSTTINETYREKVKGSVITAGNDIRVKAQNLDTAIIAGGESDINLIGSELKANDNVSLSADGDVTLSAQNYKEFERHETVKKGFGGLSGRNTGSASDATLLNSSYLINSGNTSIVAGKDIGVIASEVSSGGNINLNAVDEVLIAAGDVLRQTQQWDEKTSFLSGGNLFEMEKKRQGQETSTAQSSVIQSGGSLSVDAGAIKIIGSELTADENVSLAADTGDVEILAAKEMSKRFESEEKLSIGLGTTTKMLMGDTRDVVKVEDGKIKASLGKATYDKVKQQSDAVNHKGSVVSAQNDLSIEAESSILVEGSTLASDTDGDNQGDLRLTANDDITIKEAIDTFSERREEVHGKAEASVVVQHQAVEVAKAAQALKESTSKLKQAKQDYKQYQKNLSALEETLLTLESEYAQRKPGVQFEDIEELQGLISDVKSDEAWYASGVVLASEDVASKTTALYQQTAALATSVSSCVYCFGFNAGIQLDVEASQTNVSTQRTEALGSNLSGQNVQIAAGRNKGNQVNIQGSTLQANNTLGLSADEINITASQNTYNDKTESKSGAVSASMTIFGATSGINLNANFNRNERTSSSVTHNNSQLSADNIEMTSVHDTNIKGANVSANETLELNTGGDLNVASVQDRYNSSDKGMGLNAGIALNGGSMSKDGSWSAGDSFGALAGGSGGVNYSNGRTRTKETVLTSITSSGSAHIDVAGNTDLRGVLIATQDSEGRDTAQLNLSTGSLTYADLSNTDYRQSQSAGISGGFSVEKIQESADGSSQTFRDAATKDKNKFNSSSYQYSNTSGYSKSKTLATIGQGNLTISDSDNSHDLTVLNRDIEQTEKDLFTVDRKQGDFDVTVDHRLLTEDGRKAIAEDLERTKRLGQAVGDVVTKESITIFDTLDHISDVQKDLDVQKSLALADDGKYVDILENKQNYSVEEYDQALDQYAQAYASVYGVTIESAKAVATEMYRGMTYSNAAEGQATNSRISIDYNNNGGATDVAETMGHEAAHVRIDQGQTSYREGNLAEEYADTFGKYSANGMEFSAGSYTNVQLNVPKVDSGKLIGHTQLVDNTTQMYQDIHRAAQGDGVVNFRQLETPEIQAIRKHAPQMAKDLGISTEEAEKRMAEELVTRVDSDWQDYYKSKGRKADGEALNHLSEALSSLGANYVQPDLIPDPEAIYTPDGVKADLVNYKDNYEHRYNDATLYGEGLVTGDKEQQDFYINNLGEHKSDLGETASGTVAGVAKPILDVVDMLEWGINNPEEGVKLLSYGYQEILNNPGEVVEGIYEGYVDSQVNSVLSSLQGDNYNAAKSGTAGTVQLGLDVGAGSVLIKGAQAVTLPDGGRLPNRVDGVDSGDSFKQQTYSTSMTNEVTPSVNAGVDGTYVNNAETSQSGTSAGYNSNESARGPPESTVTNNGTTRLWRVVEAEELADVKRFGDYNIHPNSTFKRFAFDEKSLDDFIAANPNRTYTKTYIDLPPDKLNSMTPHPDPGGVGKATGIDVYDNPEFYDWFDKVTIKND